MLTEKVKQWRHAFKLDPNKVLSDLALQMIGHSGTDVLIVGGTDGITFENTWSLLKRIRKYSIPCVQEISTDSAVVPGFDGYLIPSVCNTEQAQWIHGAHLKAIKKYGDFIPWQQVCMEGYVVLNSDAKVARLTGAQTTLQRADLVAYARLIEHLYRFPLMYIEYSGTFGNIQMVQAAKKELKNTRLIYGGGITTEDQARTMAEWADTIVVGNLIYTNVQKALQTVGWVKETTVQR
ncbi:heptaprenylglyceryl phosphate synthase [Hazenella coriacea]|uniref:Heptaprenylglyceryl phosphate synthase n=1 Tax=Hazenella coriacea TaxID=1179467 RepID=A0A4R3L8B6_9BACL|nr:heptaprenylglyceryl phosphate synthase [Hazenella coriacea]TCS95899.1 putative glycerol-1-phosphate prenyltransferase [Hazenella coriacea]